MTGAQSPSTMYVVLKSPSTMYVLLQSPSTMYEVLQSPSTINVHCMQSYKGQVQSMYTVCSLTKSKYNVRSSDQNVKGE